MKYKLKKRKLIFHKNAISVQSYGIEAFMPFEELVDIK